MVKMRTNKINLLVALFVLATVFVSEVAVAQIWIPVQAPSGSSQTNNGRTVYVTSTGVVRMENTFSHCDAYPYNVGNPPPGPASPIGPGSFTFTFSRPVTSVRFVIAAVNYDEEISFYVDGAYYPITAANLQPQVTCDPQFQHPLTVVGGNLRYQVGNRYGSGIVEINIPTGMNSAGINNVPGTTGTVFGFFYEGIYAEAFNDSACHGDTLRLFGRPTVAGMSYRWTGPNGFVSTDQNPTIPNATPILEGEYVLRTVLGVDTAYDTTFVKIRPVPAAPKITADTLVCVGGNAELHAESSTPGVDYIWYGPNGYKSTFASANVRNVRYRDTGIYTSVVVLNGCRSPEAYTRLQVGYPVSGDTTPVQICRGSTYDFYGKSISTEGIHGHTLAGASHTGCDSIVYIDLTFTTPPADTITAEICQGSTYRFNNRDLNKTGYYLDTVQSANGCDSLVVLLLKVNPPLRDTFQAFICPGDSYPFKEQNLSVAGYYADTLQTPAGCDSILMLKLSIYDLPTVTASFEHYRTPCLGDTIMLHGSGGIEHLWYNDRSLIGKSASISYTLSQINNNFTLKATDANGCTNSTQFELSAPPCCQVFVPNAFTPNNDGKNDEFRIYSESQLQEYKMDIANRWGQLVFTSANPNIGWDGLVNGQPAEVGTYFYQIKGKCLSGTEIFEKGDLTLIK